MTQTKMEYKLLTATWEVLTNRVLAKVGDGNASMIGGPSFTEEDQKLGEKIMRSLGREVKGPAFDSTINHPDLSKTFPDVDCFKASTDLGNVSWMVPTLSFKAATVAVGTPLHSWEAVSQTSSLPALKAGMRVSQWMAASALDCLTRPEIISEAWKEHNQYLTETEFYHSIPDDIKVPIFQDLYGIEPEAVPELPE
jgi:aminobenzoyl-glutamate utilization protein B